MLKVEFAWILLTQLYVAVMHITTVTDMKQVRELQSACLLLSCNIAAAKSSTALRYLNPISEHARNILKSVVDLVTEIS